MLDVISFLFEMHKNETNSTRSPQFFLCPKKGGDKPSCKECVTWGCLGDWCKPPPSCCPTGPRRGALLRLEGRFSGLRKPPTSLGSWYAGVSLRLTRSRTPDCPPTGRPNQSWTHPLWLLSFWRSGLTSFLFETGERSSRGPQPWYSSGLPWQEAAPQTRKDIKLNN